MKKGPPQGRFGGCLIMGRKVMGNAANCSYLCRSCTLRYTSPSLLGICSTYRCDCGQAESGGNAADERAARMLHGPSCRKRRPGARGVFLAAVSFAGMPVFADLTCGLWTIIHPPISWYLSAYHRPRQGVSIRWSRGHGRCVSCSTDGASASKALRQES